MFLGLCSHTVVGRLERVQQLCQFRVDILWEDRHGDAYADVRREQSLCCVQEKRDCRVVSEGLKKRRGRRHPCCCPCCALFSGEEGYFSLAVMGRCRAARPSRQGRHRESNNETEYCWSVSYKEIRSVKRVG